jgi:hypothetical protein
MKTLVRFASGTLITSVIVLLGAATVMPRANAPAARRKAVVIELFTSEGCSSCPPADALLTRLGRGPSENGAEIIPLGFHVDYWNSLGWEDRFSSRAYSARQEKYAVRFQGEPYTPQLVVDGESQLVGSDSSGVEDAILRAAARPQQSQVQLSWETPGKLLVKATGADEVASGEVLMAVTEDDLSSKVAAGENGGHVLHHFAVVRDFRLLGQLSHGRFQAEVPLKPASDWKIKDRRVVAFVQSTPAGAIEGAAALPFDTATATVPSR